MLLSAGYVDDALVTQEFDQLRLFLVQSVTNAELHFVVVTPTVNSTFFGDSQSERVASCDFNNALMNQ